jgi:peptidoglycan hydrolase FlgJ
MSINPGSDLLSDALMAAEPQRAKAAADRLASLAASPDATQAFEAVLTSAQPLGRTLVSLPQAAYQTVAESLPPAPVTPFSPFEQFAIAVLKPLFELMLPEKAEAATGSGFAGGVWKSMLAQSLAEAAGKVDLAGIAHLLQASAQRKTEIKTQS